MELKKIILWGILVFTGLYLWNTWQAEHTPSFVNTSTSSNNVINQTQRPTFEVTPSNKVQPQQPPELIHVKTNVLDITIDPRGGSIIEADLLKYSNTLNDPSPVVLLNNHSNDKYLAQSGVVSDNDNAVIKPTIFKTDHSTVTVTKEKTSVILTGFNHGLAIKKTYTFDPNSYVINLSYELENNTNQNWSGYVYTQLTRNKPVEEKKGMLQMPSYTGAAYSMPTNTFQKISFEDIEKQNLNQSSTNAWVSMMQHYFVTAWIPDPKQTVDVYTKFTSDNNLYTIGDAQKIILHSGEKINLNSAAQLYVGPAINHLLIQVAPNLNQTIGYGWIWFISGIIFWMMNKIYLFVGNWGWSIVLVTILIKAIFYKLSATSYRSMAKMRKLQPRITALKETHGDDKQAFHKATMELYRTEKVNPMGGCLPILVQIPVFIGLYYVLLQSVELRHAPFIFWIHDLSVHDPLYILPVLMGLSMLLQQKISPAPPDPMQAKMMMMLPIVFTVFFLNFPAGLVLYWLVNNMTSILQQWYIMRRVEKETGLKR